MAHPEAIELIPEHGAAMRNLLSDPGKVGDTAIAVDSRVLDQLCRQIGRDNVREIADMFFAELESAIPVLQTSCDGHDRESLAATAHRLKGGARSLGAAPLGELLHQLEQQAGESEWAPLTELVGQLQRRQGAARDLMAAKIST